MYAGIFKYVFLIVGFVFLVKGADVFVDGSSALARRFNISDLIIGLTIVALGTSAPEIAVSTVASLNGANEVAISNIIGSNMFNLLMVIGVCAIIKPILVKGSILKKEMPFSILAAVVLFFIINDKGLNIGLTDVTIGTTTIAPIPIDIISRNDGIILLAFFAIFLYSVIQSTLSSKDEVNPEELGVNTESKKLSVTILFIVFGGIAIVFGGELVVNSAVAIATDFGLSETLIGLTIVSVGTSLPELVTSVQAARKGSSDMALGNVVGSNIFNIFLTLGISSTISPILVTSQNITDAMILMILSVVVFIFAFTKKKITRGEGIVLVVIYAVYMVYICMR